MGIRTEAGRRAAAMVLMWCSCVAARSSEAAGSGEALVGPTGLRMCAVVGEHWGDTGLLDRLQREGWAWAVEVLPAASDEALRAMRDRGFRVVVDMKAHPRAQERDKQYLRRSRADGIESIRRMQKILGRDLIWQILLEDDSAGVAFPQELLQARPRTHREAKALFDRYLDEVVQAAGAMPDIEKWGMAGFSSGAHLFASRGVDCVIIERCNDDVEDLQTAVSFARGAARQFGCDWGIDLSTWWGVVYGVVSNMPASIFKRHLYVSRFSGADTFRVEGADFIYPDHGTGSSHLGRTVESFARAVKDVGAIEPDVVSAIILPPDHGWMTPPYWRTTNEAWNYARVPYRPGDRGIDGFFTTAFPGSIYAMDPFPFGRYAEDEPPASPFSLSCVTPAFAPGPSDVFKAEPPLPFGRFKNRDDARRAIENAKLDPSPYRAMGDSRWGDIFDVLTAEAPAAVVQKYPVVILLGAVQMNAALKMALQSHVNGGGTVICAAGVVGPADEDLTGVRMELESRVGRAWRWGEERFVAEPFRHVPVVQPLGPETVVCARSQSGEPVVVRHACGKGAVYTCLVPWYEGGQGPLAGAAARLFEAVLLPLQPVCVEGLPVEWVSGRTSAGRYVLVANHDSSVWQGRLLVRGVKPGETRCTETLSGRTIPCSSAGDATVVNVQIPPYDVCLLQWTNDGEASSASR